MLTRPSLATTASVPVSSFDICPGISEYAGGGWSREATSFASRSCSSKLGWEIEGALTPN